MGQNFEIPMLNDQFWREISESGQRTRLRYKAFQYKPLHLDRLFSSVALTYKGN
jgi:hypothetical protein